MKNFDISAIRSDFPLLTQVCGDRPIVYFDNAATAQKPQCVIDALVDFYSCFNANVHRGAYRLSQLSSDHYETARQKVAKFLGVHASSEIIFTRNATEAINLVAGSWGKHHLKPGDEVIISILEHHANWVPWQVLAEEKGLILKVIPLNAIGELDFDVFCQLVTPKTRFLALTAASNTLGIRVVLEKFIHFAKKENISVLVDACQAVPHFSIDVQALGIDFLVFTGHKLFAPNGVGVLYGKKSFLEQMPPYQTGGGMIERVSLEKTTFRSAPERFEAGTPAIADAIGLGAAIDYLKKIDDQMIIMHEQALLEQAVLGLKTLKGLQLLGEGNFKVPIISFNLEGVHAHDVATYLDHAGICVRAGHHCTQPLLRALGVSATVRASFAFYNTFEEIDYFIKTLHAAVQFFKP